MDREYEAYKKGYKDGYTKALDDHNILHGKAAENFLAEMKQTESKGISPEQKKFLEECISIYEESKP